MGKNLIQQRRGKGHQRFRSPGFRYKGAIRMLDKQSYVIKNLIRDGGHTAPLIEAEYNDKTTSLLVAPEGVSIGDTMTIGHGEIRAGNIMALKEIPEGTSIFCIEAKPGDGGKFVRSSGVSAKIVAKSEKAVTILLPSKKQRDFHPECKATIGIVAGGGRTEKPMLKAGKKHFIFKARNKFYPVVSGSKMNAVAHPFGNKRSSRKSKARPAPKNAPPGRNVGMIRPSRSGRR